MWMDTQTDRQMDTRAKKQDMMKLTVAFRNSVNVPKNTAPTSNRKPPGIPYRDQSFTDISSNNQYLS
jgi:hypothetical protein